MDASDQGAGAVLLQASAQEVDHPISYFFHKFNKHQCGYSTCEKNVGVDSGVTLFLSSALYPIEVYTCHNPLVFLGKIRNKNQRFLCWSLQLQEDDLKMVHICGRNNVLADGLSHTSSP